MSKPRIGLAALSATNSANSTLVAAVNRAYVDAVASAGGLPYLLPVQDCADAADVLAGVDGLLLCGGVDIDPSQYGAAGGPDIGEIDPQRDVWELALARCARAARLPLLGVCRGEQLLNVSAGGTLVRDVPTATGMNHRDTERSHQVVHDIWVEPDSLVAEVCESVHIGVNTLHHQAVERLGAGLRAVAWASDSTIEAVESTGDWLAIGVQWHPELLVGLDEGSAHRALFSWLVACAHGRRLHALPSRSSEVASHANATVLSGVPLAGRAEPGSEMERRQAS